MLYIFPTLLIKISYKWFIFHFETGFPPPHSLTKAHNQSVWQMIWYGLNTHSPPKHYVNWLNILPCNVGTSVKYHNYDTLPSYSIVPSVQQSFMFSFHIFILSHSIVEKANVCFVETVRETKAITLEFRLNEHHFSGNNNITSDTTFRVDWPDLLPWHLAHWLVLTLHYIDVTLQNRAMLFFFPQNQTSKGFYLPVKSFDVSVWQNYIGSVCLIFTPCCTFQTLSSSIFSALSLKRLQAIF